MVKTSTPRRGRVPHPTPPSAPAPQGPLASRTRRPHPAESRQSRKKVSFAKTRAGFKIKKIRWGQVTCYMNGFPLDGVFADDNPSRRRQLGNRSVRVQVFRPGLYGLRVNGFRESLLYNGAPCAP